MFIDMLILQCYLLMGGVIFMKMNAHKIRLLYDLLSSYISTLFQQEGTTYNWS